MNDKKKEEYLQIFAKYQEDFVWILRQQEKLRLEYLMFLKKDVPEIMKQQKIKKHLWNKKIYEDNLRNIISDYSKKIELSIELLSEELVDKIKEKK